MKSNVRRLIRKRWFQWGVVPIVLVLVWLILSLFTINRSTGFTVLLDTHSKKNFSQWKTGEILQGEKVSATFVGKANYLGLVAVRFNTYDRLINDRVIFRLKEKNQRDWYYQNSYLTNQFLPDYLFTFGFPPIPASEGKTYYFEIESTAGIHKEAIALSSIEPVFVTKYQYPRAEMLKNTSLLTEFFWKKITSSFLDIEFLVSSIVYFFPLLFYLLWLVFFRKYLFNRYTLTIIQLILIAEESFLLHNRNSIVVFILILCVVVTNIAYKLSSRVTFLFATIFLFLAAFSTMLKKELISEDFALWTYILLCIGFGQMLWEMKRGDKGLVDYDVYLEKISGHIIKWKRDV